MRQLECELRRDEASPSPASSSSSLSPAQQRGELLLNVAHLEADMQTMFDDFVQYTLSKWAVLESFLMLNTLLWHFHGTGMKIEQGAVHKWCQHCLGSLTIHLPQKWSSWAQWDLFWMDSLESLDFSSFVIFYDGPSSFIVIFCHLFELPLVVQYCDVICERPLTYTQSLEEFIYLGLDHLLPHTTFQEHFLRLRYFSSTVSARLKK